MKRIVVTSKVSSDGILHLSVPVGLAEAAKEVQVTVDPVPPLKAMTQQKWHACHIAPRSRWSG